MNGVFALALAIGFVAGLRSMIAPAVIAWAACLGWINLQPSSLAWMGSTVAVAIFSLAAAGELIADKLTFAPARTAPAALLARIFMGAFSGASLSAAMHRSLLTGAVLAAIGSIAGAFAGYRTRIWLVRSLHTRDSVIAIAEDLIALGLAIFVVSRSAAA